MTRPLLLTIINALLLAIALLAFVIFAKLSGVPGSDGTPQTVPASPDVRAPAPSELSRGRP
jgi:hypothetical protein